MSICEISLQACPADLREATEKRLSEQPWPWELLSVTAHEATPYIDKSQILMVHQTILCKDNTFLILDKMDDGTFQNLDQSMLSLGTLNRIMEKAPAWMGLGQPTTKSPS